MLLLTSTSDLVQVITASAGAVKSHASVMDVTGTPQVVTPVRTNTASITTATTTTVVGSPAASTQRNVKHLSLRNTHASVSNVTTVQHTDGTNVEELWKGTLLPGESVVLDADGQWTHYSANGDPKIAPLQGLQETSLLLTSTTSKVQVVTASSVTIVVKPDVLDITGDPQIATPVDLPNVTIPTNTTTDVIPAPAASHTRTVRGLSVTNAHASSSNLVTIQHTDGTVAVPLWKGTLLAGESVRLGTDGRWTYYGADGATKSSGVTAVLQVLALTGDHAITSATPTEVTGLKMLCGVGTWVFRYHIRYNSSAAGTGVKFSVNHDGTVTSFLQQYRWVDASATASTAAADQDAVGAAGQAVGAMAGRAKSTAGLGTTISVDTQDADMLMIIEGMCVVTVAGELELWHGSEGAVLTTVKEGSVVELVKAA